MAAFSLPRRKIKKQISRWPQKVRNFALPKAIFPDLFFQVLTRMVLSNAVVRIHPAKGEAGIIVVSNVQS